MALPAVTSDELARRLGVPPAPYLDDYIRLAMERLSQLVTEELVMASPASWAEAVTVAALISLDQGGRGVLSVMSDGSWSDTPSPSWAAVMEALGPCLPTGRSVVS